MVVAARGALLALTALQLEAPRRAFTVRSVQFVLLPWRHDYSVTRLSFVDSCDRPFCHELLIGGGCQVRTIIMSIMSFFGRLKSPHSKAISMGRPCGSKLSHRQVRDPRA